MSTSDPYGHHDRSDDDNSDPEALPEPERVDDAQWSAFVDNLQWHTSNAPDVTPEEISDVLDDEDWVPPEPEPIGWRTGAPSLVLGLGGALSGMLALFFLAIFFRPVPGWALVTALTLTVASAVVLFSHLPSRRDPFADGREV